MFRYKVLISFSVYCIAIGAPASAEDWPPFSRTGANGVAASEGPTTWSETENVKWRVQVTVADSCSQ